MSIRIGLVGTAAISDFYVRALKEAGCVVTAVSSRPGSKRLADFSKRHKIEAAFDTWEEMLQHSENWDGLVIASHMHVLPAVLERALPLKKPILVEKPVGLTSSLIEPFLSKENGNVLVGYNRRFYKPIQFAKDFVRKNGPVIALMNLPESILLPAEKEKSFHYLSRWYGNSCHGIDLLQFIFGKLNITSVDRRKNHEGDLTGLTASLKGERGDLVQLSANWGAPGNFSLTLDTPGKRVELKPFEVATVYEGMDVLQPDKDNPIRRYMPRVVNKINLDDIDLKEKPGFTAQARALRNLIENQERSNVSATLQEAFNVIQICEDLVGIPYPIHEKSYANAR